MNLRLQKSSTSLPKVIVNSYTMSPIQDGSQVNNMVAQDSGYKQA